MVENNDLVYKPTAEDLKKTNNDPTVKYYASNDYPFRVSPLNIREEFMQANTRLRTMRLFDGETY